MTARRAGNLHRRIGGDPPVVGRVPDDRPGAIALGDLDHRDPMPGLPLAHVVGALRLAARVDDVAVHIFVVDREHVPAAVGEQRHPVIVVAEGAFLARAGPPRRRIEPGRVGPHRIAPPGNHVPAVAFRHRDGIQRVRGDRLEPEAVVVGERRERLQRTGARDERGRTEGDAPGDEAAPGKRAFGQALEIGLRFMRIGRVHGHPRRRGLRLEGLRPGHSQISWRYGAAGQLPARIAA